MNIKYILLLVIILIVIYLLSYHNEHMTLQEQQIELDMLNNQYDNSIPEDEKITNNIDKRAEFVNKMSF